MIESLIDILLGLIIAAVPVILAITTPIAAEGWVANRFGDSSARAQGRLTFNPLPHIDQIGTLAIPFICFVFSRITGAGLLLWGWAKPLQLNPSRMRRPRISVRWVAGAQVAASFLMLVLWAILHRLLPPADHYSVLGVLRDMAGYGITVNAVFTAFGLIPIPPLPAGRVLVTFLSYQQREQLERLEPHANIIVLVIAFSGLLQFVIVPVAWLGRGIASLLVGF